MRKVSWLRGSCVVFALLLAACGGGGGGNAPASISYSGATNQAVVNTGNARALSLSAFQGGQTGSTLGIAGFVTGDGSTAVNDARLQAIGSLLAGAVGRIVPSAATGSAAPAGASAQVTIPGPYGGSMTYAISYNEISGAFSGTITFNAYKGAPNGAAVSGSVGFSGTFDPISQTFTQLTISFSSLVVTEGAGTFAVSGSVSVSTSGGTETTSMSLVLQASTNGKTYWVKDYTYTLSGGSLTISGTYYDPDYGYVTVTTQTPLQVTSSDAWPTAGVLIFTGANGTKARLTFTSATSYTVEVDTGSGYTVVP